MNTLSVSVLAVAALFVTAPAQAAVFTFGASPTGLEEVPSNASPGVGSALVAFDDVAHTLSVDVSFSGLTTPTVDSHIHCCAPPGTNAAVAVGFTPAGFPLGVTSGAFSHVFDLTDEAIYNPPFLAASGGTAGAAEMTLVAGLFDFMTYVNIHTEAFPGGEIRGQLAAVPEPAMLGLLLVGLAGLAVRRRV